MSEVTLKNLEQVILILPNGRRVSVVYADTDDDAIPELDIHFGEDNLLMCNTWAYGHDDIADNPSPTLCNQIVIPIGRFEDEQ